MSSLELQLYELLKIKLGEKETKTLIDFVEDNARSQKDSLATRLDLEKTKSELILEIEKVKADVTVIKWMLGVVIAGILSLVVKSFF